MPIFAAAAKAPRMPADLLEGRGRVQPRSHYLSHTLALPLILSHAHSRTPYVSLSLSHSLCAVAVKDSQDACRPAPRDVAGSASLLFSLSHSSLSLSHSLCVSLSLSHSLCATLALPLCVSLTLVFPLCRGCKGPQDACRPAPKILTSIRISCLTVS